MVSELQDYLLVYDYVMYVFLHVIQYTATRTCTPQVHVAQDACICQFVT